MLPGLLTPFFSLRPVFARIYQTSTYTHEGKETPISVGQFLAPLRPTFVMGLMRAANDTVVTPTMVRDYNIVKDTVTGWSPGCLSDVWLQADQYRAASDVVNKMAEIEETGVKHEIWSFDFWGPAYVDYPDVVNAAINYAHRTGKLVGGNVWSGPSQPPGCDFLLTDDNNFEFRSFMFDVHAKYPLLPLIIHLNNNPQNAPNTECYVWVEQYTPEQRQDYLKQVAAQQNAMNFHWAYPVFFPEYPAGVAFDLPRSDPGTFALVKTLI